ncbi:methyltransferase domain-containing protein [Carboxydochorda subterranea]|uniref:Methyltransferase domain-containing protein n=1 Tax=Carboxydichorda subterranea TaxID=3109565 RepID=A0ABZ1C2L1_9FIRM|nr:methyltransferase domain-containing protein [Limnochorda sp. L945t]WRP18936.1 methyltransferase domain-containing protein [Limnochorda sp. L945t]
MVDALPISNAEVQRIYDRRSRHYARTVGRFERRAHLRAIELAQISPGDKVLEVAVGPGTTLVEILARVEGDNVVHGVDISTGMLRQAARTAAAAGYANFELRQADARQLPYPDHSFDLVYNGYMLDLMNLQAIRAVLAEFRRVLRPGGRLVLVHVSKRHPERITGFERLYEALPKRLVPRVLGLCRPLAVEAYVREAGFVDVVREFVGGLMPSEIIVAHRSRP